METTLISLDVAKKELAQEGTPADINTLIRWIVKGVGKRTKRVQLRGEKRGGRWYTSREWLREFFARRTADSIETVDPFALAAAAMKQNEASLKILESRYGLCRTNKSAATTTAMGSQPTGSAVQPATKRPTVASGPRKSLGRN